MKNTMMKEAHKLTKEIKAEFPKVDYAVQLGLCIKYLNENKNIESKTKKENKLTEFQEILKIKDRPKKGIKNVWEEALDLKAEEQERTLKLVLRVDEIQEELKNYVWDKVTAKVAKKILTLLNELRWLIGADYNDVLYKSLYYVYVGIVNMDGVYNAKELIERIYVTKDIYNEGHYDDNEFPSGTKYLLQGFKIEEL